MIFGIGVDLVDISRVEKLAKRYEARFYSRILTEVEKKDVAINEVAARFAAKEAFVKALGTGFRGISFMDIEVLNDANGKPYYQVSDNVKRILAFPFATHLSITHERGYAIAMALIEKL